MLEELSTVMPMNKKGLRLSTHKKLDTKPKWLNGNKATRSSFRNRAYLFNTLPMKITSQGEIQRF